MSEMHGAMAPECKYRFDKIDERLEQGDRTFNEQQKNIGQHSVELAELRTNTNNLIKSMDAQTKAIWGMVMAVASIGIGFIIWFIQARA